MSESRLLALEELAAHQARVIEELSGEVARQWAAIAALERRLADLGESVAALDDAAPAANRKPPHW